MALSRVKEVSADLLELYSLQQGIKEHLIENKHVVIMFSNTLNPSDVNSICLSIILTLHLWDFRLVLK